MAEVSNEIKPFPSSSNVAESKETVPVVTPSSAIPFVGAVEMKFVPSEAITLPSAPTAVG